MRDEESFDFEKEGFDCNEETFVKTCPQCESLSLIEGRCTQCAYDEYEKVNDW
jgi:hypothetical protein